MKVRQTEVSEADRASASIFFDALTRYWDLSEAKALDMFARTGELTVTNYRDAVAEIDLWELNPEHEPALRKFEPNDLKIGCSYQHLDTCEKKYDFIVVDTPQGIHSDHLGMTHVEHFDVLRSLTRIMEERCIVVLYVNMAPYNRDEEGSHGYDEYDEYDFEAWMEYRADVFGTDGLVVESQALKTYEDIFLSMGYVVRNVLMVPCFSDAPGREPYAFRLALDVVLMGV